ncbi:MAG: DUF1015 domain-containing protein [Spirochaetes bacterium]|nr:DUF1015 domain-containing protein [Spirochaetota bacterium]
MATLTTVKEGYIPANNEAAEKIIGPNYDEFQNDLEIYNILKNNRCNILSISMPHCDVDKPENFMTDGSDEALEHGLENFIKLINSNMVKKINNFLWVYEIISHRNPNQVQLGIGGMGKTSEIRTDKNPKGTIIRNEEVYQAKVEGRAKNIKKLKAFLGVVNNALEDKNGKILNELNKYKNSRNPDIDTIDEQKNVHKLWLVTDKNEIENFQNIIKEEEFSFVADGNHRSAAAASLGYENFLTVFFPMSRMGLLSYNRLLKSDDNISFEEFKKKLSKNFEVQELNINPEKMPDKIHSIFIYTEKKWLKLTCKMNVIKPENVVQEIDSNIVQRKIFDEIFNIQNTSDKRINYVGGNKDIDYMVSKVENNEYKYAILLPPVDMKQFAEVSKQNLFMPPKSTWFDPKIRIGLIIASVQ